MFAEWNDRALAAVERQPDVPLGKGLYSYQTSALLVGMVTHLQLQTTRAQKQRVVLYEKRSIDQSTKSNWSIQKGEKKKRLCKLPITTRCDFTYGRYERCRVVEVWLDLAQFDGVDFGPGEL